MLFLAWAETISIVVAIILLVWFIFRGNPVVAAITFCVIVVATLLLNFIVVRLVRHRAELFSAHHRAALSARGVGISAHLERWELVCTRVELWFELVVLAWPDRVQPRHIRTDTRV